jgi:hypothetical protein
VRPQQPDQYRTWASEAVGALNAAVGVTDPAASGPDY